MAHWDRDQPLWEHDCDSCEFLGNFTVSNVFYDNVFYDNVFYDLYYHPAPKQHKTLDTYVARYSSDGPDYHSGKSFVTYNPALAMAYARHTFREF